MTPRRTRAPRSPLAPATARAVVAATLALGTCATPPLSRSQHDDVSALARELQARAYPELMGVTIDIDVMSSADVFFESNFDLPAALAGERRYRIAVNPQLFERGAPRDALAGVLAHELAHTYDYHRRDAAGLLALLPVLVSDDDSAVFERWTDLQAVARGFGPSLLRYRQWLQRVLTKEQWQRKRVLYYDPRELAWLIDVRERCPALFLAMLDEPPRSARDIATHCP